MGLEGLGWVRRPGRDWKCQLCQKKCFFPPVKSSSVVRIRTEFSVSNFAGGGNCFLLNGPHCCRLSKEDSFSAQLAEKVFSLKTVQKAIPC